jgi:hypothetical protein
VHREGVVLGLKIAKDIINNGKGGVWLLFRNMFSIHSARYTCIINPGFTTSTALSILAC